MCGKQAGQKSPNLKKMLEQVFHLFRKRPTASRKSKGIVNKLFEQGDPSCQQQPEAYFTMPLFGFVGEGKNVMMEVFE